MKAQDLRVGNIIENGTVIAVHRKYVCVENGDGAMYTAIGDDVLPVALSDEWLKRCGFKIIKENGFSCEDYYKSDVGFSYKDFLISKSGDAFFLWIEIDDYSYSYPSCEIKYLHQLQNLYFAMEGEELQIII